MLGDKKKGGLSIMFGIGKPSSGDEAGMGDDRKEMAGKALAKAIRSGDGIAVADAFQELMSCCKDDEGEEEKSEGSMPPAGKSDEW